MQANRLQARILVSLAVLVVAMSAYSGVARPAEATYVPSKVMWVAKRSNVRAGPGTSYRKVGLLEIGEEVRVTAKAGNWYQLEPQARQPKRFVYAPLLTVTELIVGTITYNKGGRYHGQTRYDKPHGHGVFTWPNGNRYEGDFVDGDFHGRGVATWADGTRYEGDFVDGKRTGHGVQVWPNGDRCEGQWRDNEEHGHVACAWANGNRYEGDFVDGKRTGRGVYTWPNGDRYEGQWRNDKKTGRGVFIFADGDSNVLEWKDGTSREAHRPASTCLDVERVNASMAYWVNQCSVGIDVVWRDEGGCRSRAGNKWPCSWFVAANKRVTAGIEGHVWWHECESPGGLGDVITMHKNGRLHCLDSSTSRTVARKQRQLDKSHQVLADAQAATERAQQEREHQAAIRRMEEELRIAQEQDRIAAERRRREAQMWNQVGKSLGTILGGGATYSGDWESSNPSSVSSGTGGSGGDTAPAYPSY